MTNVIETWYYTYSRLVQGTKDDQERQQICFNTFLGPGNNGYWLCVTVEARRLELPVPQV